MQRQVEVDASLHKAAVVAVKRSISVLLADGLGPECGNHLSHEREGRLWLTVVFITRSTSSSVIPKKGFHMKTQH